MSILPVRDLGNTGVVTDKSPYNIPLNAFNKGFNVRFDEGKVSRGPIFRKIKDSLGFTPRFSYGIVPSSGFDTVLLVSDAWVINEYASGTVSNVSGSITGSTSPLPYTGTSLAGVTYVNRADRVPVYRTNTGSTFADLPNWDATHKCASLRSFGDQLIALNMVEGSSQFSNANKVLRYYNC